MASDNSIIDSSFRDFTLGQKKRKEKKKKKARKPSGLDPGLVYLDLSSAAAAGLLGSFSRPRFFCLADERRQVLCLSFVDYLRHRNDLASVVPAGRLQVVRLGVLGAATHVSTWSFERAAVHGGGDEGRYIPECMYSVADWAPEVGRRSRTRSRWRNTAGRLMRTGKANTCSRTTGMSKIGG